MDRPDKVDVPCDNEFRYYPRPSIRCQEGALCPNCDYIIQLEKFVTILEDTMAFIDKRIREVGGED